MFFSKTAQKSTDAQQNHTQPATTETDEVVKLPANETRLQSQLSTPALSQRTILQLQRSIGNKAVMRLLAGKSAAQRQPAVTPATTTPAQNTLLIQRAIETMGGEWDTDNYDLINGAQQGVSIKLVFKPNSTVDATKIGLTQAVKSYKNSKPYVINNDQAIKNRMIPEDEQTTDHMDEPTGGYKHDRMSSKNNPIYGGNDLGGGEGLDATTTAGNAHLGWRYKDHDVDKIENPWLTDAPKMNNAQKNSGAVFETTALAIDGTQKDTFYGSVKWGWRSDNDGNQTKLPLEVISHGAPSPTFIKTAKLWEANPTSGGGATKGLPVDNLMPVFFEVQYATKPGEDIYVAGNVPELGNWEPARAAKLRYADPKTWKGLVTMNANQAGKTLEYKYLVKKDDQVRWEEGGNHRPGKALEAGKTVNYNDSWDDGK